MRLGFDGKWSAEELGQALISIADLYNLRLFLEYQREEFLERERAYEELLLPPSVRTRWRRELSFLGPLGRVSSLGFIPQSLDGAEWARLFVPEERLQIRRISYASPGFSDLAGIGTVVGHLKDFILKLVERRDLRTQRELNDERAALENERMRIENARNFVALGKDLGYSEMELRVLVAYVDRKQEPLVRLADKQKLSSVSTPESSNEE